MGLCLSTQDRTLRARTLSIDKHLAADYQRRKRESKILLLGAGESGKSTIVKQMKIIHLDGYSYQERLGFRRFVWENVVEAVAGMLRGMERVGVGFVKGENETRAQKFKDLYASRRINLDDSTFPRDLGEIISKLWDDAGMVGMLDRTSEFYCLDSAPYFLNSLDRIRAKDYVPTVEDVLRARVKTTGVTETRFSMGQLQIHMFDVGGQRSERRKWIHCFEAVTSIIFCMALSEYDQVLLEDSSQNRLGESLVLFESVINSRWFLRSSIILFLNKVDIFRSKISRVPLEQYFPDYAGGADINKAAKYILYKFTLLNRAKLKIYPHLTCATDTSNIRLVFAAVKDTILQNALKESGIL